MQSARASNNAPLTDLQIMELYRGKINNIDSSSALRRGEIERIPESRQLSMIYDEKFYPARDRWGIGIVHDMAMFGEVRTQVEIVVNHRIFDTPKFDSKWGTPPDLAAILGCWEAKMQMIAILPEAKLVEPREHGRTRLHDIAGSQGSRQRLLMLLDQVPNLLSSVSRDGESLARVIWKSGDKFVRRELYERVPLWNWYDNHPSQRKP